MSKRRESKDGLASKVIKFRPFRDADGRFIAYCNFYKHRGIVVKPQVCEQRDCIYYQKFYVGDRKNG